MMAPPPDGQGVLVVLGDLLEDVVLWLAEPLRRASDTAATVRRTRGGSGANVAAFAAPLLAPGRVRFLGCVGADGAGDALVAELTGRGVDVRVQRAGTTGAVVVLVEPSGERSMLPDRGASALVTDPDPAWLDGAAHLHVPAYAFEGGPTAGAAAALLERAGARGATTSVDASSTGLLTGLGVETALALLERLRPTFLLANAQEAELLGLRAPRAAPVLAATTVVVKDGPAPTTVLAPGAAPVRVPVAPVAGVRDSTGAGDAFAAGFLAAVLGGATPAAACGAGHAAAAPVLRSAGASTGA